MTTSPAAALPAPGPARTQVRTSCNRDCPDACGILATVEEGRVVRLQGDPDHPVTRGFLCYRTSRFLDRQHDPDRITTPLLRRGDSFEPVSWGAALDLAAAKLRAIRSESGGAAILNYRSGGSLGVMKHLTDFFFERFGPVAIKSGDICSGAGDAAQLADFGEEDSHDLFDLLNSRTIVLWGKNPHVSNLHLLPVLKEARERGARLVMIDPVRHRGASLCDDYLQPRPGGDIALVLGVMRWLFDHGRTDPAAAEYCDHLDELRGLACSRPLAEWAGMADVGVDSLVRLAEVYSQGPSAILVGWGMQRRANGSATVRMLDALGAVSGNIGVPGGGVSFYFKRRGAFDMSFIQGLEVAPRSIPEALLGTAVLEASDPPIRMVWVTNGNPVAMLPESGTVARALGSREFTVVVDAFMTDTARTAHLVLPATTMLEDEDLVGAYGHHYVGNVRRVVPPPAGVKTDYEIIQGLARRVGLGDEFGPDIHHWKARFLGRVSADGMTEAALREGAIRNPRSARVLFAGRRFPTPSGRINLVRDPDPTPPVLPEGYPMFLTAISTEKAQGSQTRAGEQEGPLEVTVHPARAAGLEAGQIARLESELGGIPVRIKLDDRQRLDLILMPKGGWLGRDRCANALIRARTTDHGGGAVYYDTPVRLVPLLDPL